MLLAATTVKTYETNGTRLLLLMLVGLTTLVMVMLRLAIDTV
jgi:hypothetical protein